ncbi:hypothetical protein [Dyella acidisoli]|uniref:Uncharacterized protein n=1 Tax=Dyella acidisoli TaxID=1867834 RepID=A0ABQ5XV20_9GAMM|nr:hypothetical protein [Dyella acidisoli]GLQ95575.1 hypothetical protein GCM10007901_45310 [Dyella acidisoli]
MNNENVEIVRPFARMMASEMRTEDVDSMTKNGLLNTVRSGHLPTDWPDLG